MKITFDPNEDRLNIASRGVSLGLAEKLEWDLMVCREDERAAYGELRLQRGNQGRTTLVSSEVASTSLDQAHSLLHLAQSVRRDAAHPVDSP